MKRGVENENLRNIGAYNRKASLIALKVCGVVKRSQRTELFNTGSSLLINKNRFMEN